MVWLRRISLLGASLAALCGSSCSLIFWLPFASFHVALVDAFDGQATAHGDSRFRFHCAGFDCADVLPRLPRTPAVHGVTCTQTMKIDDLREYGYDIFIEGQGACCLVKFGEVGGSEVHIYWTGVRYEILLTEPRIRAVLDSLSDREAPDLAPATLKRINRGRSDSKYGHLPFRTSDTGGVRGVAYGK